MTTQELTTMENSPGTIEIYTVEFSHPDYEGTGDMQLIATSGKAAVSRARGTCSHMYKDARWLDADYTVVQVEPFRPDWNSDNG